MKEVRKFTIRFYPMIEKHRRAIEKLESRDKEKYRHIRDYICEAINAYGDDKKTEGYLSDVDRVRLCNSLVETLERKGYLHKQPGL